MTKKMCWSGLEFQLFILVKTVILYQLTCIMGIEPQNLGQTSGNLNLNIQSDERAITNLTESIATACRHCVS